MSYNFSNCSNFNILLWFLINLLMMMLLFQVWWLTHVPWFISSACLWKHTLALLQDNCHDLVRCAFLHKLSACVRNITAFCQYLLMPISSVVLADTNVWVKPIYWPDISARPIYRSICSLHLLLAHHLCYVDVYCVCTIKNCVTYIFYLYYSLSIIYCFCK